MVTRTPTTVRHPLRRLLAPLLPALLATAALAGTARAQASADTLEVELPAIEVAAARGSVTVNRAPLAVALLSRPPEQVALDPALSLEAVLRGLPGLWVNDRGHYALGERLSVRGMGARAAFGVRGVQVLVDGIPLTMPDGQAVLDVVDPAVVRRAELIRGPASLFWGNGSGGALFLSTSATAAAPGLRLRSLTGSHGLRQHAAEAVVAAGPHRFQAFASDVRRDGYRDYGAGRFTRALLHGDVDLGPRTRLSVVLAAADQDAENPGSLTREQAAADPRQANARNRDTQAGKQSLHVQGGATLLRDTPVGLLTATAYGLIRDLDNPLSFAFVGVDRQAGGLRLSLARERGRIRWGVGLDGGLLSDERGNWANEGGRRGPTATLRQRETVHAAAAFGYVDAPVAGGLRVLAGLRADRLHFALDDRLPADGDQSGHRRFMAWSPALRLSYPAGGALLYAGLSTAFETPTTTELVNSPDGSEGFNPDVAPQRASGLEAGARGTWRSLTYDVAAFLQRVDDQLVPFETPGGDGRTYYRNAGRTQHAGLEVALAWDAAVYALQATYSGGRHAFGGGALDGRRLPGVPPHHLVTTVTLRPGRGWLSATVEAVGAYPADDDNTAEVDGYMVVDLRAGHQGVPVGALRLMPFAQVNNVFDARYSGSIVVNAFGGRYYEPAPGRTVQAGLNVQL